MGYPIFPGEDEKEQLGCIMEIFGPPEPSLIEQATRGKLFFDPSGRPRPVISSKNHRRVPLTKSLSAVLKTDDVAFNDFIAKCLTWDPEQRLTADGAVLHPFISGKKMERPPAFSRTSSNESGIAPANKIYGGSGRSSSSTTTGSGQFRVIGSRPLPEVPRVRQNNQSPINNAHLATQRVVSAAKTPLVIARNTRETSVSSASLAARPTPECASPAKSFTKFSAVNSQSGPMSYKGSFSPRKISSSAIPQLGSSRARQTSHSVSAQTTGDYSGISGGVSTDNLNQLNSAILRSMARDVSAGKISAMTVDDQAD